MLEGHEGCPVWTECTEGLLAESFKDGYWSNVSQHSASHPAANGAASVQTIQSAHAGRNVLAHQCMSLMFSCQIRKALLSFGECKYQLHGTI